MTYLADSTLWDFVFHAEYCENNKWMHPPVRNHFHNVYEIYYLIENEVMYFIDDNAHLVKEGTVVVIPPNSVHSTCPVNNNARKRFLIYVPEEFIDEFLVLHPDLMKKLIDKPFLIKESERKAFEELFKSLIKEFENDKSNIVMQKSLLVKILVTLDSLLNTDYQHGEVFELQDELSGTIGEIANYINSHFCENITLETLSKRFFLHPTYLSRAFKQRFNISFSDYLKNIRINRVMILLKDSDTSITEIAKQTGFESTTSLCRAFKRIIGIPPLQYRKMYKRIDEE